MNHKLNLHFFLFFLAAAVISGGLLALPGCTVLETRTAVAEAVDGVIDLRDSDLHSSELTLSGEWHFYPHTAATNSRALEHSQPSGISVPAVWNGKLSEGEPLAGWGTHTYRLQVLLPETDTPLALHMPYVLSSMELWVNGERLSSVGSVSTDPDTAQPRRSNLLQFLPDSAGNVLDIVIPISNYDYRKGGMVNAPSIGSASVMARGQQNRRAFDIFLTGSIIIMGLHHIAMYLFRREDPAPLLFGLFCISVVLRLLSTGELLLESTIPHFSFELARILEFSPFFLGGPLFMVYASLIFPKEFSRIVIRVFQLYSLLLAAVVIVLPTRIHNNLVVMMEIVILSGLIYVVAQIVRAAVHKRPGARFLLFGLVIILATAVNDVLKANMIIYSLYLLPFGLFVFIFSQSLLLAQSFSRNLYERSIIERQKREIEEKNSEIIDSITYTKRIQESYLPSREQLNGLLREHFIIWRPRDIVGGDIYYHGEAGGKQYFCLLDCTGHGVPGAFLSTVSLSILERVLTELPGAGPGRILTALNGQLQRRLHQHMKSSRSSDGAVGVLLCFDPNRPNDFLFAGAGLGLYVKGKDSCRYIKGDRQSLGCRRSNPEFVFQERSIAAGPQNDEWIYISSDGYLDQSGGEKNFGLGRRKFIQILIECAGKPANEQSAHLVRKLRHHQQDNPQRDDITVVGFRAGRS